MICLVYYKVVPIQYSVEGPVVGEYAQIEELDKEVEVRQLTEVVPGLRYLHQQLEAAIVANEVVSSYKHIVD